MFTFRDKIAAGKFIRSLVPPVQIDRMDFGANVLSYQVSENPLLASQEKYQNLKCQTVPYILGNCILVLMIRMILLTIIILSIN